MKVIDFHTHPYLSEQEFLNFYPECFEPSPEQLKEDIGRAGIGHIAGSVLNKRSYTAEEGFSYIKECNDKALELKKLLGDFYTPGFHIHPHFVSESIAEIERMHRHDIRLIGELVPYMHGWSDYSCAGLHTILEAAEQYGMTVSFHTMKDEQAEMTKMIEAHPRLTFVAAHPNEKELFLLHLERLKKYDNFFLDLSGTGIFRYGLTAYGVKKAGSEKFVFGTDYPICNPRMYVQAILQEPVSDADRENILYRNAGRLLASAAVSGERPVEGSAE
ncbi:MAG: amidohydrolase [Ruminiclostridium sp.]|nr:amidohydrolase [Ruminiclostridium sp.]